MEKQVIENIVSEYLKLYPNERQRLEQLSMYLNNTKAKDITDWNNPNGHLTAGGFIYSKLTNKFLVLYHKDLNMFLYPGGHCEKEDNTPLDTAIKEIKEETGLENCKILNSSHNKLIPIDIDIHIIPFNARVNMPEHYHFDFRYLFYLENETDIKIDAKEMSCYKWITINQLKNDINYGKIVTKLNNLKKVIR